MLKINKTNIFFIIIAIIHFILVLQKTPYQTYFTQEQAITWITVKLVSFLLIILFWQFIPYTIEQFKNRNKNFKEFLLFSLIYFIVNLTILILIWPGHTHAEFLNIYFQQKNSELIFFWHWLSSFEIAVTYNILPYIWGITLVNSILQSFIVGFCIYSIKYKTSKNFYWLAYIPFIIPAILIQNHSPIRLIFITWLTVFFFTFLYMNKDQKIENNLKVILFGILTATIISIRTEYYPLIFIYPLMIFSLKIFNKRAFIKFLIVLIIAFIGITGLQKANMNSTYELHNLCFVYEEIVNNNLQNKTFDRDKETLKEVFIELDEKGHDSELNLSNKEKSKQALIILTKMLLENSEYFLKRSINLFTNSHIIITSDLMYKPEMDKEFSDIETSEIKPINSELRDKVIQTFTYGTEKHNISYIYNPYINLFLLGFLFIYGLIKRTSFYTFFAISWLTIIFVILLTMPWGNYLYLWAFFLNTWLFFFYAIAEILQFIYDFIKQKIQNNNLIN